MPLSAFTLNAAEFKGVTDASGDVVKVPAKVEKRYALVCEQSNHINAGRRGQDSSDHRSNKK